MGHRLSQRMISALKGANKARFEGGLVWTGGGWKVPGAKNEFHGPIVVSDLVHQHAFLAESGEPGRQLLTSRRLLTATWRAYLAELEPANG